MDSHRQSKRKCPQCKKTKTFSARHTYCGRECANEAQRLAGQAAREEMETNRLKNIEAERLRAERARRERELLVQAAATTKYNNFVEECLARELPAPPEWLLKRKHGSRYATPLAFLSDAHFGERVFPSRIEGLNAYDRKIAEQRLRKFFENATLLAKDYLKGLNYPGIVMPLGGDMFSGDIHEELAQTNEGTMCEEVLYWLTPMLSGIRLFAEEFGKVFIPVVPGNHPRTTRKPSHKLRVPNNFDWLFAEFLRRQTEDDKRIEWKISPAADCDFKVYGTTYRLSHGDQFRGGSGIAGLLSPLMIGDARKRKRSQAAGQSYDYLLLGHWHQRSHFKSIMVNGSLKGYDEYAYDGNFDFQPPEQSFWVTDDEHGVTIEAPIHVQSKSENWSIN